MMNKDFLKKFNNIQSVTKLNERIVWDTHDAYIFEAERFEGNPIFYPIFKWQRYYSFSPLALAAKRGKFTPSEIFRSEEKFLSMDPVPADMFADDHIQRIGGPPRFSCEIRNLPSFSAAMAAAMQHDIAAVEAQNTSKINIVLCGGKDSLNLLLLRWRNPVIVYSAYPNFRLVRDFVVRNGLHFEVRELIDKPSDQLESRQIAESFCAVDLTHWKWTVHLYEIAQEHKRNVIFWKGQLADAFLTDYWRSYTHHQSQLYKQARKALRRLARVSPSLVDPICGARSIREFALSLWLRGGVNQGLHMGFLRSITDALVLSGYHGPATSEVWQKLDLRCLAGNDVRPEIGRILLGKEVHYPPQNPAPIASELRRGYRDPQKFRAALQEFGIVVES